MHTGTNLVYVQAYNQRIVLETIRLYGPLSRADVARQTGLTKPTVSTIVAELMAQELVVETSQRQSRKGGKPATDLEINPEGAFTVGLALGRDRLSGVLVNLAGVVRARVRYDLEFPSPDETVRLMEEATGRLMAGQSIPSERLWGVGVGMPGPLDTRAGNVVSPPNFPGWEEVPIVDLLRAHTGHTVYLENNATAAAIGETWYGVGRHVRSFFYVFFGVGLGGGLIINGEPYRGASGNAGAFGNAPVVSFGAGGTYTGTSRLEDYASLGALNRWLGEHGVKTLGYAELGVLCERGYPPLMAWLRAAAHYLAPALANIENTFDPEAVVFGGRLPEPLLGRLIEHVEELLPRFRLPGKSYTPKLVVAQAGEDAAALGVATLPIHEALTPSHEVLLGRGEALKVGGAG